MMRQFVAYYRVSTQKQGRSGLGLDAQKAAVLAYIGAGEVVASYTDIESGKRDDRPELTKALMACKRTGATLVIAKLDRLSRDVAFIATLMKAGVEFIACDMPTANKLTIHILAAVAEAEREMISLRTKAALEAAKARGVRLGNPTPIRSLANASLAIQTKANNRADNLTRTVQEIRAAGIRSLNGIAKALTARGAPTARGGVWTAKAVSNLLKRQGCQN